MAEAVSGSIVGALVVVSVNLAELLTKLYLEASSLHQRVYFLPELSYTLLRLLVANFKNTYIAFIIKQTKSNPQASCKTRLTPLVTSFHLSLIPTLYNLHS